MFRCVKILVTKLIFDQPSLRKGERSGFTPADSHCIKCLLFEEVRRYPHPVDWQGEQLMDRLLLVAVKGLDISSNGIEKWIKCEDIITGYDLNKPWSDSIRMSSDLHKLRVPLSPHRYSLAEEVNRCIQHLKSYPTQLTSLLYTHRHARHVLELFQKYIRLEAYSNTYTILEGFIRYCVGTELRTLLSPLIETCSEHLECLCAGNHDDGNHDDGNHGDGNHDTSNINTSNHDTGTREAGNHDTSCHDAGCHDAGCHNTGNHDAGNNETENCGNVHLREAYQKRQRLYRCLDMFVNGEPNPECCEHILCNTYHHSLPLYSDLPKLRERIEPILRKVDQ